MCCGEIVLLIILNMSFLIIAQRKLNRQGLLGCYRYTGTIEEIRGYQSLTIPVTNDYNECIEHCENHAYQFAGIIIRSECHCSDVTPKVEKPLPINDCFGRCEENPFYNCGGFQKISLLKNRFFSGGRYMDWGMNCIKGQPSTPLRLWKAAHERSCLHYEYYSSCLRKSGAHFQLSIHVPETFAPYFCVRHCKRNGFGYAALNEQNRMCSCQQGIGKSPPCNAKEEERKVFITYSHYHDEVGCHLVKLLPRDHPKKISNLTYLSDCAFHCVDHEFFGYSLNATCGCEKYYLSSSDRLDELCDATCDWAPVDRCGGSNVVAVYRTGVKSMSSEYTRMSNSRKGYIINNKKEYGIFGLLIAFFGFILVLLWTNQKSKTLQAQKLEDLRNRKLKNLRPDSH